MKKQNIFKFDKIGAQMTDYYTNNFMAYLPGGHYRREESQDDKRISSNI